MSFPILALSFFVFGAALGFCVQRAGICFAHGFAELFVGRRFRMLRLTLVIIAITATGFYLSAYVSPQLGLKPVGAIRGYGFYNLLAGIIFGAGVLLNGGCILGTLRQIGEGNLHFLVALVCFAPGMALVVHVLNPMLEKGYATQKVLLPQLLGLPTATVTGLLVVSSLLWFSYLNKSSSRGK